MWKNCPILDDLENCRGFADLLRFLLETSLFFQFWAALVNQLKMSHTSCDVFFAGK